MFTWLGAQLDQILSSYVLGVVTTLMERLMPVALSGMTLWISLYGWAIVRGEASESVSVFAWKAVKMGLILAFSLQSGVYISSVADTANGLALGVATSFTPADIDPATVSTAYALLDKFNDQASEQVADLMKEASLFRLDLLLAAAIFSIGTVAYLCVALFVLTLSKVLMTFVIAIGPLFVLSLAWKATARFFDSWLSMLLNVVVLTWFAFFALGLSTHLGAALFRAIQDGGTFLGGTFNVLGEATRYCVLMILMAIVCFQAPSLASALTGGASVQQGIQILQNTLVVAGMRSATAHRAAGTGHAGPGRGFNAGPGAAASASAGPSAWYAAGQSAGVLTHRAGHALHQGYASGRLALYQLAALRGRSA